MGREGRYGKYGEIKRLERLKGKPFPKKGLLNQDRPFPRYLGKVGGRLVFKEAEEIDKRFVKELSERLFSSYGDYGEFLADFVGKPGAFAWIAMAGKEKVGFGIAAPFGQDRLDIFEITAIGIAPEYQGKGFGKMLLDFMLTSLKRKGIKEAILHTGVQNKKAQHLFLKKGFLPTLIKKSFYKAEDAIMMKKKII